MKHQKYKGYPNELHFVCHEAKGGVYRYASLQQRGQVKELDMFFTNLEEYGFDVLKPTDGFAFEKAQMDLNAAIRRQAVKDNAASYEQFTIEDEICRCGKWVFLMLSPYFSERQEMVLETKGKGGFREGAGRKGQYAELGYDKTAVIRVPRQSKDDIKRLVEYLVAAKVSGVDIDDALSKAVYALNGMGREDREAAMVIDELRKHLPWFSVGGQKESVGGQQVEQVKEQPLAVESVGESHPQSRPVEKGVVKGKLTQEERWQRQYDVVMNFIEENHRRPSKYKPEEKLMVHWLRRTTKLYNRGELPPERIERFEKLMEIVERYRRKNQYE